MGKRFVGRDVWIARNGIEMIFQTDSGPITSNANKIYIYLKSLLNLVENLLKLLEKFRKFNQLQLKNSNFHQIPLKYQFLRRVNRVLVEQSGES